jgi:uncharacterized membrane protein
MKFFYFLFRLAVVLGAIAVLVLITSAIPPSGFRAIPIIGIIIVIIYGWKWLWNF